MTALELLLIAAGGVGTVIGSEIVQSLVAKKERRANRATEKASAPQVTILHQPPRPILEDRRTRSRSDGSHR